MSTVLYRKYRAQNFDELLGQDHITKILKNAIKSNQLSHAYLFVGSRGTGKTSTARILAKAVNCLAPLSDGNPCNKCEVCKGISEGTFLDLIEIDAASNRGIDQIRDLKERIEFSPSLGKYKVYIIDEVHMLTNEAFNALLKTLEEPPEHIIFILATTEGHKLPATVLSRCQRYDFKLGSDNEVMEMLKSVAKKEKLKVEKGALEVLVKNARGSFRDALSLLDVVYHGQPTDGSKSKITEKEVRQVLGIPEIYLVEDLLSAFLRGSAIEALESIKKLEVSGMGYSQFISYTLEILREVLVAKLSDSKVEYSFAKDITQRDLIELINAFIKVERDLKGSSNHILILQMLIPTFCHEERKRGTIVEKESEKVEVVNSDANILNLEELRSGWKDIVERIKMQNTALSVFLSSSRVAGVSGDTVSIEVPFKFYKERIEEYSSKQVITNSINELLGVNCRISCTVNALVKPKIKSSADVVLKNVPVFKKQEERASKKKELSTEVEAIFAGM